MPDGLGVVRVPLSLQVCDGENVALTFGPMPPVELLAALAQLETLDGQLSFHQQLVEGLQKAKEQRAGESADG